MTDKSGKSGKSTASTGKTSEPKEQVTAEVESTSSEQDLTVLADVDTLMNSLNPMSSTSTLSDSIYLAQEPQLKKLLESGYNTPMVCKAIQYLDNATYQMNGDSTFKLDTIRLIKKMNPTNPACIIGVFQDGDHPTPMKDFDFIPLIGYMSRAYFKDYNPSQIETICSSTNGFQGVFKRPTPYVKSCAGCPYKEWGCSAEGKVDRQSKSKPLCRPRYHIIGITKELDRLVEIPLSSYCLSSKHGSKNKLLSYGRLFDYYKPSVCTNPMDTPKYQITRANITKDTQWLKISGNPVTKNNEIVSAATKVEFTGNTLAHDNAKVTEEQMLAITFLKFASAYVDYQMAQFQNYMDRSAETSVVDCESGDADTTVSNIETGFVDVYDEQ